MHKYGFVWKYCPPKTIGLSSCSLLNGYTLVGDIPNFRTRPKDVWLVAVMVVIYIYSYISHYITSSVSAEPHLRESFKYLPRMKKPSWNGIASCTLIAVFGMWKLDMEFSQHVGCPENCHLKQDMMINSESGFQILRRPQNIPEWWSKLGTHSSMANFMSWREATNVDIVFSCEQDEHKHTCVYIYICIILIHEYLSVCLCRIVYIIHICVRIYIYVCIFLNI